MALSILDGNQSATTLSTIVTSGQHIPAHTVVSLGTQAIANITSAVSGTSVTFGFVGGTVTANNFTLTNVLQYDGSHYFLKVGGVATTGGTSFPVYIAGSVTANPTGTQTIAGTVTANAGNFAYEQDEDTTGEGDKGVLIGWRDNGSGEFRTVTDTQPLPISGTVTANTDAASLASALDNFGQSYANQIPVGIDQNGFGDVPISGTVTANINDPTNVLFANQIGDALFGADTLLSTLTDLRISGTVTVGAMPSGALTTRFGSVVTADLATLTSAVTNTSRKYLLVQNIATSTVTIGIGFAPTTTQGIQLTAGAGLTFDAFTPTGAIYWLSSVTGSNFSILEG
jgi:hypothetical protein